MKRLSILLFFIAIMMPPCHEPGTSMAQDATECIDTFPQQCGESVQLARLTLPMVGVSVPAAEGPVVDAARTGTVTVSTSLTTSTHTVPSDADVCVLSFSFEHPGNVSDFPTLGTGGDIQNFTLGHRQGTSGNKSEIWWVVPSSANKNGSKTFAWVLPANPLDAGPLVFISCYKGITTDALRDHDGAYNAGGVAATPTMTTVAKDMTVCVGGGFDDGSITWDVGTPTSETAYNYQRAELNEYVCTGTSTVVTATTNSNASISCIVLKD